MSGTDRYDAQAVEKKWQTRWAERGTNTFSAEALASAEEPFYNLMMFPYPSAEGLHIGNIYAFTGADVHGRYWRLRGKTVFEPMGFDAFGIHSENYALKVGTNPNDLIPRNVANFTRQLQRIGGMFDWNHVVDTTDPSYYKWTQWIFLKLFDGGLVERRNAAVNWCPSCKTVLANEQVVAGLCERCDTAVEQRQFLQWFFKIGQYAGRLLDNIANLDWSDSTRKAQANWIGRSEGAEVDFPVQNGKDVVRVFTTRPDTLFGATYMVLAPEHPLVDSVTTPLQRPAVDAYREQVTKRDLVDRKKTDKQKTGVFTGGHCVNPINGEAIPVWIADYVLMDYGTGAIMAVPGHDERDFEFAQSFGLPIVRVIAGPGDAADTPLAEAYVGDGTLVNSGKFDGASVEDAKRNITAQLASTGSGSAKVNYRLHDWCVSRQRYWGPPIPIVHCDDCGAVPVPESELPVLLPRVEDFKPDDSGISPLARVKSWFETTCPSCAKPARRETDVSDTFLDSAWYFLRYPSAHRDDVPFDPELTRKWLPVHSYIGGNEHAVLHLMYSRFVTMALKDLGHIDFEEPFTRFRAHGLIINEGMKMSKSRGNVVVPDALIEQYGADTVRVYLMFLGPFEQGGDYRDQGIAGPNAFLSRLWQSVLEAHDAPIDEAVERKLHQTIQRVTEQIPDLHYNTAIAAMMEYLNVVRAGGRTPSKAEIAPLVVMIAPFAPHIAEELLKDLGHIDFEEPFTRFRAHGLIINEGMKMSKSRGNVVVPDALIEQYGADTVRVYLMFLGPFEQGGDYRDQGIAGPNAFLSRLWQSVLEAHDAPIDESVERKLHQTIQRVTEQIPDLHYNTAIAAMMEYLNVVRAGGRTPSKAEIAPLVVMIAPFAPHIAEELYTRLGHNEGLFESARWPTFDPAKTVEDSVEIGVQVNGKLRGRVTVAASSDEKAVVAAALANDNVARFVDGKSVRKQIYVPGKLLNLVVG